MWPLESRHDVVRLGAHRVERWVNSPAGLVCVSQAECEPAIGTRHNDPARLAAALGRLIEGGRAASTQNSAAKPMDRADLVLESPWLPVMLLEAGPLLWSRNQVEALLRHRLARLFDSPGEAVAGWDLIVDHRAGDLQGLGYGLAPPVKAALTGVAAQFGVRWTSMQPAFSWGWQRLRRQRRSAAGSGWWLWLEQDRTLVCHVQAQRVATMNAGAAPLNDVTQCRQLVSVEALRQGVAPDSAGTILAGWQPVPANVATAGVSWVSVGGSGDSRVQHGSSKTAALMPGGAA